MLLRKSYAFKGHRLLLAIATIATATVLRRVAAFPLIACFASLVSSFEDFYSAAGIEKMLKSSGVVYFSLVSSLCFLASLIALGSTFLALGGSANRIRPTLQPFGALAAQTAARAVRSAGVEEFRKRFSQDRRCGRRKLRYRIRAWRQLLYCSDAYFSEGCLIMYPQRHSPPPQVRYFSLPRSLLPKRAAKQHSRCSGSTASLVPDLLCTLRPQRVLLYDNRITCVVWIANFLSSRLQASSAWCPCCLPGAD